MFNRLWIRISIIFLSVLIIATVLPFLTFRTMIYLGIMDDPRSSIIEDLDIDPEIRAMIREAAREERDTDFFSDLLSLIAFWALFGGIAGLIASRTLIQPLTKLEKAAHAIGEQRLETRVEIERSSQEIQAVAQSFNTMAEKLQLEEKVRKNLIADIAHELRTPLTVVQGNLRAMLDGVYPTNAEEISNIYLQTELITRLVDDLHLLSQAEAHQLPLSKEPIDVSQLIQQTAATFQPVIRERALQLRPELLGKLPLVEADRARLTQVIHNLMTNAIRHTPARGTITLQAEADVVGIEEGQHRPEKLFIRVIDSGSGISAEHLPHVFDRFYRTDPARARLEGDGGTGLGLAITRALIEAHDGEISVSSEGEGQGSQFEFWLPI
ncbi:MAG: ATP-binding protein [Chloroflexota bacterium]